jgi:hypothetical protein
MRTLLVRKAYNNRETKIERAYRRITGITVSSQMEFPQAASVAHDRAAKSPSLFEVALLGSRGTVNHYELA